MKAFIAFGANLGKTERNIAAAIYGLGRFARTRVTRVSRLYKTEAVGGPRQPDYRNGVLEIETALTPAALMRVLLMLERSLGRIRRVKWGPRVIDLDLIAYGRRRIRSRDLVVPHPRYHQRRFVLAPFCDIAPRFVHPRLRKQNRTLLRKLTLPGQRVTIVAQWNGTRFTPSKQKRKQKSRS